MFEHFKGEEVFVKKVLDYLDQVQYKQRLILTQFLDPYHQSIVPATEILRGVHKKILGPIL